MAGGIIGTAAYLATAPKDTWNLRDGALVALTGAAAVALIATGVGAAAGFKLASGALMATSTAAIFSGAGFGIVTSGGFTLYENKANNEEFHAGEFIVNSVGGAVDGAFTAAIPGVGLAPTAIRAASSGAIGTLQYVGAEMVQGRIPTGQEAGQALLLSSGAAFMADAGGQMLLQGVSPNEFAVGNLTQHGVNSALNPQPRADSDLRGVYSPGVRRNELGRHFTLGFTQAAGDWSIDRFYTPR